MGALLGYLGERAAAERGAGTVAGAGLWALFLDRDNRLLRDAGDWPDGDGRAAASPPRGLARRAVELGRDDAVSLGNAGLPLIVVAHELDEGAALLEQALALNQNLAWVWQFSALAKAFLGEPEAAIEQAARAMRLSPQDPQTFGMQVAAAWAHFFLGRDEEAWRWAEAALRQQPRFLVGACVAAAAAAHAGRQGEAARALALLRDIDPALRLGNLKELLPFRRPEDFARWAEGLRLAGLPE
ncbi:MAG TPA: hypothetical protein VFG47_18020 [Geminicoccaceae bacterium]|nr:hypothetical protein [Geminicoccaceae bacterium]